ncbi:phage major capsid protein [Epibacterium sp. SM1979]|uniref:Phage major capsid protein n=1 Tax=Tritonibacter litoralis TaxID=2662264 RepID=A0A843YAP0_9RHOB|nr:phage major capsid protein [Tritonibacter litoralis]MQQ06948.1 phage major capsid protein [Tritonibacter litoralis]
MRAEPETDLQQALEGFVSQISDLQAEVKSKLQQQDERMTMLDRSTRQISTAAARPQLATSCDAEAPHQKAFDTYLRTGDDADLRGLEFDTKALSTAVNTDGGYLVDPVTSDSVNAVLASSASLRSVAAVVHVEATSYDVLVDHAELGSGWASETATATETATGTIERIAIPLHELSALPKVSQRLLDDSAFEIETWLAGRIATTFARAEAAAFVNGDGIDKPTGFLTHPVVDNESWTWGNIGYVVTGTDGALDGGDAIIDLVYALGADYRANGTFVMNSKTAGLVRKLKDGDGRFLWTDGLAAGEPALLLGYPVVIAEDMPDVASNSYSIAFGDFGTGYTIAERPDLRVLRDPFSAKPHVLFYATKRVGGDVSDFAAIKLLKFGTS